MLAIAKRLFAWIIDPCGFEARFARIQAMLVTLDAKQKRTDEMIERLERTSQR